MEDVAYDKTNERELRSICYVRNSLFFLLTSWSASVWCAAWWSFYFLTDGKVLRDFAVLVSAVGLTVEVVYDSLPAQWYEFSFLHVSSFQGIRKPPGPLGRGGLSYNYSFGVELFYLQKKDRNLNLLPKFAELMKCDKAMKHSLEVLIW